jgi:hypothetical protein
MLDFFFLAVLLAVPVQRAARYNALARFRESFVIEEVEDDLISS